LAAAALVVLSAGGGLWYARHTTKSPDRADEALFAPETQVERSKANSIALTKLALEDQKRFEAQLAAESRGVLPDFTGPRSTLSVLAKD
jgi:hypothetical protein